MINLTEIFWAQLILVGIGTTLQLIAFCTFARDPHLHGGVQPDLHDEGLPPGDHPELSQPLPPVRTYYPHSAPKPDGSPLDIQPAQLAKTKKVAFKQRFEGLR